MAGLSDEEMASLEAKHAQAGGMTDEQMQAHEAAHAAKPKESSFLEGVGHGLARSARAAINSGTLGLSTRGLAAGDALTESLTSSSKLGDEYDRALTRRQKEAATDAAEAPSASIVGGFLPAALPGGLSAALARRFAGTAGTVLGKAALAAPSTVQRLAGAAGAGALSGNLNAPHDDPAARAKGTLEGGLSGLAGGAVMEAVPALATKAANAMRSGSNRMAANVAGGGRGQISDRLAKLGIDDPEHFGGQLLDEGLIPTGINPFKAPSGEVLKRAQALKAKSGNAIGETIGRADTEGAFDPREAQVEMLSRLPNRTPLERENSSKATNLVRQVGDLAGTPDLGPESPSESGRYGTFGDANATKSQAWQAANFRDTAPMEAKQYRKAVSSLRDSIRNQVGQVSGEPAADALTKANRQYGLATDAESLAGNDERRANQNGQFGLLAKILGGAGIGGGIGAAGGAPGTGGVTGAALAAGEHYLKRNGPAIAARAGRFGSDVLPGAAERISSPVAGGAVGSALERFLALDDDKKEALLRSLGADATELR